MYLNPNWRILTVGDGDLSFSNAVVNHIKPAKLVASTYDSAETIEQKYQHNALNSLKKCHVEVINCFDDLLKNVRNHDKRRIENDDGHGANII